MTNNNDIPGLFWDESSAAKRAHQKMIDDSLSVIREQLKVADTSPKNLKGFHMFKSLGATITQSLMSINQNYSLQVSIASYLSSYTAGRYTNVGSGEYLFGYFNMVTKYPKTYMHKETIREKLTDLFLKHDVDFEHSKKFSGKFQVLTEDEQRLQHLLQFKNLDVLTAYPEMELEFNYDKCLFRSSRKSVSMEEAIMFCELAKTLLKMFN